MTHRGFGFRIAPFVALGVLAIIHPAFGGSVIATYSVADESSGSIVIPGSPGIFGGEQFEQTVDVGGVIITWKYTFKIDALQNRILTGTTTIINTTSAPITVDALLETVLSNSLVSDVVTGGMVTVKLVTDVDGGQLSCGDQPALMMPVSDDAPIGAFFYCPFLLTFSGPASGGTSASWGLPIPSLQGPATVGSLGHQVSIGLTAGDKAILTMLYAAKGTVEVGPPISLASDSTAG